jgi:hypothetical protein
VSRDELQAAIEAEDGHVHGPIAATITTMAPNRPRRPPRRRLRPPRSRQPRMSRLRLKSPPPRPRRRARRPTRLRRQACACEEGRGQARRRSCSPLAKKAPPPRSRPQRELIQLPRRGRRPAPAGCGWKGAVPSPLRLRLHHARSLLLSRGEE